VRLPSVWSRRLLEIENIGDQVVGLRVGDYQINHSPVIKRGNTFNERAVGDGILAISTKLGTAPTEATLVDGMASFRRGPGFDLAQDA
jgi:hypothetical protein